MIGLLALLILPPAQPPVRSPASGNEGELRFGAFGQIAVYRPPGAPSAVALFFSGDGGWNQGVIGMAHAIAANGTLILGVDTPHYLKALGERGERCAYFAGDAELLSQYAQQRLGLPVYQVPLLIGYSSGAGLAYATLAQAPDNTFLGAVSLGFDPDLPTQTSICERNGLTSSVGRAGTESFTRVNPVSRLPGHWLVLQGAEDQVWPLDSVVAFAGSVTGSEVVRLPRVGHGFSLTSSWLPQLKEAVRQLSPRPAEAPPSTTDLADLPMVELPPPRNARPYFALILSGDGGWASIDRQLGDELVRSGVPVVGFNSLQYFWRKRTPEEMAADLERIIRHYQTTLGREQVVLIGYSRGADVLPLMASRLPAGLLAQVRLMAFLGLERSTDLEFRLGDWLGARHDAIYPLLPELEKLRGRPMLCVYGTDEGDDLCPELPAGLAEQVPLRGGHHFDGDFTGLAHLLLSRLDSASAR